MPKSDNIYERIDDLITSFAERYSAFIQNQEEDVNRMIVNQLVNYNVEQLTKSFVDYVNEMGYNDLYDYIMDRHKEIILLERF